MHINMSLYSSVCVVVMTCFLNYTIYVILFDRIQGLMDGQFLKQLILGKLIEH